ERAHFFMLACSRREKTGFTLRIHFETVQLGDVLRQNFSLILRPDALEVLGDLFARVRPKSCAVGKVRRPEQIVDTDLVPMSQSIRIIDKRCTIGGENIRWASSSAWLETGSLAAALHGSRRPYPYDAENRQASRNLIPLR